MKKPLRIFSLPSHQSAERTSGVDFLRVIQPMEHLARTEGFDVKVWDIVTDSVDMKWNQIAKDYDIIYFNYMNNPWGFAAMGAMARHYGKKLVMDFDDNLWNILPDNTAHDLFKKGSEGLKTITAIANEVDYVTCTNSYLKNVIAANTTKRHEKIKVLPNYIDLDFYSHKAAPRNERTVNIGHFGSSSHFASLTNDEFLKGMDRLMSDYPNIRFITIGSFFSDFKMKWGLRYIQDFGDVDIYRWVKDKLPGFADNIDFFVTPVVDNVYNRCKSATKFNEVSSTGRPGVWQRIRQYSDIIQDGNNGFLASSADEWYSKMKRLVDDATLRQQMGEKAYQTVKNDWTIQKNLEAYKKFFRGIINA